MKILYLCFDPSIDLGGETGGAVHIRALIRALTDLGHEVVTICSCVSRRQRAESQVGGRVIPCEIGRWNDLLGIAIRRANQLLRRQPRHYSDAVRFSHNARFFRTVTDAVRQFSPDFIYERYSLWGLAGFGAAKRCRVPFVLEVNAPLVYEQQRYRGGMMCPSLAQRIEGSVWRGADLVIAVSEALSSQLLEVGVNSTRIQVPPNGVDSRWFRPEADGPRARKPAGLENCFVVGFVGSFKRWHGADFLLWCRGLGRALSIWPNTAPSTIGCAGGRKELQPCWRLTCSMCSGGREATEQRQTKKTREADEEEFEGCSVTLVGTVRFERTTFRV